MAELKKYNGVMVVLHWLLAVFILGALFMGLAVLDEMPADHPQKIFLLKTHVFVGIGILLFTLLRLAVRILSAQPEPLPGGSPVLDRVARGVHLLLYLLTLLSAVSGIALAIAASLPDILLKGLGTLPHDFEDFAAHELHGLFADLLLLTIALHTAAALYHHFILRDGILSRMSLRK